MKTRQVRGPWVALVVAWLLASLVLALGYLSLQAAGAWPWGASAQAPSPGTRVPLWLLVVLPSLAILVIVLGFFAALDLIRRMDRAQQRELAAKNEEWSAAQESLVAAVDALRAENAFHRSILETVSDPIMVIGVDYQVKLMNRAALATLPDTAKRPNPRCYQVCHQRQTPCDGTEHPCPLARVRESGAPVTVVHEHYQADGRRRFVEVAAAPLMAPDGSLDGIVEALRDVTQSVRTAQALRAANRLQQLLVDEVRERIARDLHDGLAQLLGYVNTKVMAVRLMIKNQQLEAADEHLLQLEEAARQLFADLRQAIFDLRNTGQDGAGLGAALQDLVAQFERLSGPSVQLALDPALDSLALTAETELQLLRITQEALANVRKHAAASRVEVSLGLQDGALELGICDDGAGFDPASLPKTRWPHFGLSIMRERAEAIGAEFSLTSTPGQGTRVSVRLAVKEPI